MGKGMKLVKSDRPVLCDLDDTLVRWKPAEPHEEGVEITCKGVTQKYVIYWKNVEQVKQHNARGHAVFLLSNGGWEWVKAVVDALELAPYLAVGGCKPKWLLDDEPASVWMPENYLVEGMNDE